MQFGGKRINKDPEPEESHFLRNLIIVLLCLIAYLVYGWRDDEFASSNIQYSSDAPESPYHQNSKDDKNAHIDDSQSDDNGGEDDGDNSKDSKGKNNDNTLKPAKAMDHELQKMNPHVH